METKSYKSQSPLGGATDTGTACARLAFVVQNLVIIFNPFIRLQAN